jgi:hypothetical protein
MFRRLCLALPLVLATTALAGCQETPRTTIPDPVPTVKPFSGTLTVNGGATHRFTTTATGNVTVEIKELTPTSTVMIGLSLGLWTGASCNMMVENPDAVLSTLLTGVSAATGEFCARVYDLGRLTAPTGYAIEVKHF